MDNLQLSQSGSIAFASAALALSTNTLTVKTTAIVPFIIDGQWGSYPVTDNIPWANQFTPQTFNPAPGVQPVGTTALYGIFVDSNNAITMVQGKPVSTSDLANGAAPLQFPTNTDAGTPVTGKARGRACLGFVRVANASSGGFTAGTTALNTAGLTVSYINCATVPGEPLRS
jgi:hypothetical protein